MNNIVKIWMPFIFIAFAVILSFASMQAFNYADNLWRWLLFFNVGCQGVWAWMGQAFHSKEIAASIGWEDSPFLFEVACANLGAGIAGLVAPWMHAQYWMALSLANGIFLWGAAWGHIREMIKEKNFSPNNCGPIFITDIVIPLLLLILFILHVS